MTFMESTTAAMLRLTWIRPNTEPYARIIAVVRQVGKGKEMGGRQVGGRIGGGKRREGSGWFWDGKGGESGAGQEWRAA